MPLFQSIVRYLLFSSRSAGRAPMLVMWSTTMQIGCPGCLKDGDTAGSSGSLSSVIQWRRQDTGPPSVVSVKSGGSKSSNGGTKSGSKPATILSKGKQQKNVSGNSGGGAGSSKGRKKAVRDADDDGSGTQPKPKKLTVQKLLIL